MARWPISIFAVVTACAHPRPAVAPDPGEPARDAAIAARAAPFVDAYRNTNAMLAADGKVAFVSTRDGLPQLYVADASDPTSPPRRLRTPERVVAPRLLPDGKAIVFLSDVGADRRYHIYRIALDGSGLTDLTPGDTLRRDAPSIARATGTLIYSAHVLEDPATHVFAQASDGAPREIYRDPGVGSIYGVNADGTRALYLQTRSDSEQVLYALDVATGATSRLFPPDGQRCAIGDASFTADGARVITGCETRGRPLQLVALDARTGAVVARAAEAAVPTAALAGIAVSPRGDRAIVALVAGDHIELRALDPRDLHALPAIDVPLGALGLEWFDATGDRLTLTLNLPGAPAEIAALDIATGRLAPLRREPRPGLGSPPRASIEHLRAFDGRTLPVNVYLPEGDGPRPTLVWVHGGPSGNAKLRWSTTVGFWTAMGFAVVEPNIRGSSGFGMDYMEADDREKRGDAVRDVETLNRWARAQPWCDPDRLVIGGGSYGGYMTLLALTRMPTLWRAGIDVSGMSNLETMEQLEDQTIRVYDETEFGVLGKDAALLKAWSPITAVERIVAPVFVYQGERDPVTPRYEADQIVAALRKRGVPVEYMLLADEGHGIVRRDNEVRYLARAYRFIAHHLGLRAP